MTWEFEIGKAFFFFPWSILSVTDPSICPSCYCCSSNFNFLLEMLQVWTSTVDCWLLETWSALSVKTCKSTFLTEIPNWPAFYKVCRTHSDAGYMYLYYVGHRVLWPLHLQVKQIPWTCSILFPHRSRVESEMLHCLDQRKYSPSFCMGATGQAESLNPSLFYKPAALNFLFFLFEKKKS